MKLTLVHIHCGITLSLARACRGFNEQESRQHVKNAFVIYNVVDI